MDSLPAQILVSYLITIVFIVLLTLGFWRYLPRLARHAGGSVIVACLGILVFSIALISLAF